MLTQAPAVKNISFFLLVWKFLYRKLSLHRKKNVHNMDCPKKKKVCWFKSMHLWYHLHKPRIFGSLCPPPPITYYGSQRSGLKPFASEVVKMNEFFIIFGKSFICINWLKYNQSLEDCYISLTKSCCLLKMHEI